MLRRPRGFVHTLRACSAGLILMLLFSIPAAATPPDSCGGTPVTDNQSTDAADYLAGTLGDDVAALGLGADQYFADDGNDVICGNEGADLLVGESGSDMLIGGAGPDHLVGALGDDTLVGGGGPDVLEGGSGSDTLRAGLVDNQQDVLYDGPGTDTIIGNDEDIWYRCGDATPDDHSAFTGQILPDPNC